MPPRDGLAFPSRSLVFVYLEEIDGVIRITIIRINNHTSILCHTRATHTQCHTHPSPRCTRTDTPQSRVLCAVRCTILKRLSVWLLAEAAEGSTRWRTHSGSALPPPNPMPHMPCVSDTAQYRMQQECHVMLRHQLLTNCTGCCCCCCCTPGVCCRCAAVWYPT